jgi:hypothetical protein
MFVSVIHASSMLQVPRFGPRGLLKKTPSRGLHDARNDVGQVSAQAMRCRLATKLGEPGAVDDRHRGRCGYRTAVSVVLLPLGDAGMRTSLDENLALQAEEAHPGITGREDPLADGNVPAQRAKAPVPFAGST